MADTKREQAPQKELAPESEGRQAAEEQFESDRQVAETLIEKNEQLEDMVEADEAALE